MASKDDIDRLEGRFDALSAKIDNNHAELTKAVHDIELKVTKHEQTFSLLRFITPPGAILGIIAFFRDLWK